MGMTSKSNICHFTGLKIDPGRGILFARNDGQLFHFLNSKARQLYNNKKRPSKIGWTMAYRKLHKKGRACERLKRKKRLISNLRYGLMYPHQFRQSNINAVKKHKLFRWMKICR